VSEPALIDELTAMVGSRQEAVWIVQAAQRSADASPQIEVAAREMAARRSDGEPLQYVLGTWDFREIELIVDQRALIPRPETEQVVQAVLDRWRSSQPGVQGLRIVDLGCGTGAIGLSIRHELEGEAAIEEVILTDRSREALSLALENAVHVGASRTSVAAGSWYEALDPLLSGSIHILVSNPPYVAVRDRPKLAEELFYEPEQALFAMDSPDGVSGFAAVMSVIKGARPWLRPGGVIGVEMAEIHVEPALALAGDVGLVDVAPIFDLAEKPRGIVANAP
jgi:release factor glutamine methyltransferase